MSPLSSLLNGKSLYGLDAERKQEETQENAFFPFLFIFLSLNVFADVLLASNNRRLCLTKFLNSPECSPRDIFEFHDSDFIHINLRFRVFVSTHQ